jgi:hypothetical protein
MWIEAKPPGPRLLPFEAGSRAMEQGGTTPRTTENLRLTASHGRGGGETRRKLYALPKDMTSRVVCLFCIDTPFVRHPQREGETECGKPSVSQQVGHRCNAAELTLSLLSLFVAGSGRLEPQLLSKLPTTQSGGN